MPLDRAAAGKRASDFSKLYETRKVKFSKEKRKCPFSLQRLFGGEKSLHLGLNKNLVILNIILMESRTPKCYITNY